MAMRASGLGGEADDDNTQRFYLMRRAARFLSCSVWIMIALALPHMGRGAIFNWQTAQVIPGTELIQPEPFMFLGDWNTEQRNLRYADFSSLDIKRSGVKSVWLENARFHGTDLSSTAFLDVQLDNAIFPLAKILGASFENVDFTGADFTAADLSLRWFPSPTVSTGSD